MKLRIRLLLYAAFLILLVCTISIIVAISNQQVDKVAQKGLVADTLVREIFDLNALTNDYLLHREERAKIQWQKKYQSIKQLLNQPESNDPVSKEHRGRIEQELRISETTFKQLIASSNNVQSSSIEERLQGKLQISAQLMVGSAIQLSRISLQERQTIRESANRLVLVLILVIALALLIIFFFIYRKMVEPITNLTTVAKQVRNGDLSPRAIVFAKDEFGDLAITFNLMLDSLKESQEHLEKKVQERTQQLETSNKDLEAFSYSVSHDLRAPLRAIDGFSQILEEDYANKFDEEGKDVIATIRTSTQEMGTLIDDLLSFSRLGRQSMKLQTINMTTLAKSVFDELQKTNHDREIQFSCEDLPEIQGDSSLLRHVWINLLSNAIKYTNKKSKAQIMIGSKIQGNDILYYVQDNGAGFDMKYVNKLFGVFQRLHDRRDFEGTGVGLAIVARVITKHGGKVWAEGEVDKGATFYFSLPKKVAI